MSPTISLVSRALFGSMPKAIFEPCPACSVSFASVAKGAMCSRPKLLIFRINPTTVQSVSIPPMFKETVSPTWISSAAAMALFSRIACSSPGLSDRPLTRLGVYSCVLLGMPQIYPQLSSRSAEWSSGKCRLIGHLPHTSAVDTPFTP